MEFRRLYLDFIHVALGLLSSLLYHCFLWHAVRTRPRRTNIGVSAGGPRVWIMAMLKNNDKKTVLAVQTLRNHSMGATLMATTSIFICCSLLAFTSNSDNAQKRRHSEVEVNSKCAVVILALLSSTLCQSFSIMFLSQVNILVNTLTHEACPVTPEYVAKLLEKALFMSMLGNRLFFSGLPLVLWVFGPELVFVSSVALIPVLYSLDFVGEDEKGEVGAKVSGMGHSDELDAAVA